MEILKNAMDFTLLQLFEFVEMISLKNSKPEIFFGSNGLVANIIKS